MKDMFHAQTQIKRDTFSVMIITAHWRECTVYNYFKVHFEALWACGIRVLVVALGRTDEVTRKAASQADMYWELPNRHSSIKPVTELVTEHKPHICLYPEVGMEPVVNALAAIRLAPVQACFWGHPASTGLDSMDVFLTAEDLEGDDSASHYSEVMLPLPGLGACFELPLLTSMQDWQASRAEAKPVLVCAQSPFKWQPEFIEALGRVLKELPRSRLRLFHGVTSITRQGILRALAHSWCRLGVDPLERVELLPALARKEFLAVLAESDVALDSFLFSGGQTSVDCLSVGLPPITLPGRRMRGKQTSAMLTAMNLQSCIARDAEDWLAKVVEQARSTAPRAEFREQVRQTAAKVLTSDTPVRALRAWFDALQVEMVEYGRTGRDAVWAAMLRTQRSGS